MILSECNGMWRATRERSPDSPPPIGRSDTMWHRNAINATKTKTPAAAATPTPPRALEHELHLKPMLPAYPSLHTEQSVKSTNGYTVSEERGRAGKTMKKN